MARGRRGDGLPFGLVLRLARADLAHEWVLSLCLVLAVAAVLAPLMLLFGLKFGAIETMRSRLVQDPRNREVRPMTSQAFPRQWLQELAGRADVAFVVPGIRQIAATLEASLGAGPKLTLDVLPTAPGDPLLEENGAPAPGPGQCVLSFLAAESLGAKVGDALEVKVKRLRGSRFESGELRLRVAGVLDQRASALKAVYAPLELLEAIENYKDGLAVPELGWPGDAPEAYPVFDGVVVALGRELDKLDELRLINGTGFSKLTRPSPAELAQLTGYRVDPAWRVYLVEAAKRPVGMESVLAVKERLRGTGAFLLPWTRAVAARLLAADGSEAASLNVLALGPLAEGRPPTGLAPAPPWPPGQGMEPKPTLMLPAGVSPPPGQAYLELRHERRVLRFPVSVAKERAPGEAAFAPPQLAGVLRLFAQRELTHDRSSGRFLLARRGYASFRLYAATIDDVEGLRRHFEAQGLSVHTEAQRIRDVTQLDGYLTLIFWLVALVGLVGGAAALTASLWASVERKQKELGVLRLLGMPTGAMVRFPLYQGLIIAVCGFVTAVGVFQALAWVINSLFQAHLQSAERLCRLPADHLLATLGGVIALAALASAAAAWRVTRIDPAEALRDE